MSKLSEDGRIDTQWCDVITVTASADNERALYVGIYDADKDESAIARLTTQEARLLGTQLRQLALSLDYKQ